VALARAFSKVAEGESLVAIDLVEESKEAAGLILEHVFCCICGPVGAVPIGTGPDFEYRVSADQFLAMRCEKCELVYVSPRPHISELRRIYPDNYHAFSFSKERFGLVYRVRERLEAARLLRSTQGLPADARILDVGCGDGFHLNLLRRFGLPSWNLIGVDVDERAVAAARAQGLAVVQGTVEEAALESGSFDLVLLIATIEHVADPPSVLSATRRLLKPGGKVLIVTDNTRTLDFAIFKGRYWGGYHFPRHWCLFNRSAIANLAATTGFEVESIRTSVSPVNWVYSIRNFLDDFNAPKPIVEFFSLASPICLAMFTAWDALHASLGFGALLRVVLKRPR